MQTIERESTRLARIADEIARMRRRRAAIDAAEMRLLAEAQDVALAQMSVPSLDDGPRDIPLRSAAASLAVVSRVADRTVQAG